MIHGEINFQQNQMLQFFVTVQTTNYRINSVFGKKKMKMASALEKFFFQEWNKVKLY